MTEWFKSPKELWGDVVIFHPQKPGQHPTPDDIARHLPLPLDQAFKQAEELVNEYGEIKGYVFIEAPDKAATLLFPARTRPIEKIYDTLKSIANIVYTLGEE